MLCTPVQWELSCPMWTRTDRQMDLMKFIITFHNLVNVLKEWTQLDMEYPNLGCAWFELCSYDWGFCGFVQPLHISSGIVPVPSSSKPQTHVVTAATTTTTTTTTNNNNNNKRRWRSVKHNSSNVKHIKWY